MMVFEIALIKGEGLILPLLFLTHSMASEPSLPFRDTRECDSRGQT